MRLGGTGGMGGMEGRDDEGRSIQVFLAYCARLSFEEAMEG